MRAAIYARVSSDRQRERDTIRTQLIELPKYAKAQRFQVTRIYQDDGVSGETIAARPGFQQLLEDAERKAFDVLLVVDLDRITRSRRDQEGAFIFDLLRTHGIKIATLKGGLLDLDNEDHDLQVGLLRVFAQHEKRKFLRRTMRGKLQAAREGKRFSSTDPYGYRWEPNAKSAAGGSYIVVAAEAKVVRRIYQLAADGMGVAMVAWTLNADGHQTRIRKRPGEEDGRPSDWRKSSVLKLLHSTTYKGEFRVFKGEAEPITIPVPAIISEAQWDAVQTSLKNRRASSGRPAKREYLLAGHATCGVCGYAMWCVTARPGRSNFSYFRCSSTNSWRAMGLEGPCGNRHHRSDLVDDAVWSTLVRILQDPKLLADACSIADKSASDGVDWAAQLNALQKKLSGLEQAASDVLRRQRRGIVTPVVADDELERIAKERKLVERNVKVASKQASRAKQETTLVQSMESQADALSRGLENASFETKKKLVQLLLPREHGCAATIHADGQIEIRGILPMPGDDGLTLEVKTRARKTA